MQKNFHLLYICYNEKQHTQILKKLKVLFAKYTKKLGYMCFILSSLLTLKFNALIHHGPVWPVHLNLACIIDLNHIGEVFQHHSIEVHFHKMAAHLHWFKLNAVSLRGCFSHLGINFLTRRTCKYLNISGL